MTDRRTDRRLMGAMVSEENSEPEDSGMKQPPPTKRPAWRERMQRLGLPPKDMTAQGGW